VALCVYQLREGGMLEWARERAQHGGTLGWLDETDPAGVILYVMDVQ
jgi:hypothetical protein